MQAQRPPVNNPKLSVTPVGGARGRKRIFAQAMVGTDVSPGVRILDPDNYKKRVREGAELYKLLPYPTKCHRRAQPRNGIELPGFLQVLNLFNRRSSKYDDDSTFHPRLAAGSANTAVLATLFYYLPDDQPTPLKKPLRCRMQVQPRIKGQ